LYLTAKFGCSTQTMAAVARKLTLLVRFLENIWSGKIALMWGKA
jgi:hypothetical protein